MKGINVIEKIKQLLGPKKDLVRARLFVSREDGVTIFDTVQDETTASVSALVSGVWQASEALVYLAQPKRDVMEFRLAFDTSSRGVFLFPFHISGKRYFLGALYHECVNPGQLKHQVSQIKEEVERYFRENAASEVNQKNSARDGFLFKEITDEEMDRLFGLGGI